MHSNYRRFGFPSVFVLLIVWITAAAGCSTSTASQPGPTNVILMISDGCGPASMTMARDYIRDIKQSGHRAGEGLVLDSIQVGSIRTFATDRRVTDSAAGATAFACGIKTYYTAVAVDTMKQKIATILEGAESKGMSTGLVATSRITHATPAAFSSHVPSRYEENEIARQQLTQEIEVILGGGRRHFLPTSEGGQREDSRNLLQEAADQGYHVASTRAEFDALEELPILGLFSPAHMSFEIDRDSSAEPGLTEMTRKAITLLDGSSAEGFFLMVEGSRIDHAGHDNDPSAHLQEILQFDKAMAEALSFARRDGNTLVISVSDHETGGLTLPGGWKPGPLGTVTASRERVVAELLNSNGPAASVVQEVANIELSPEEAAALERIRSDADELRTRVSEIITARAGVEWSTGGHTGVDVNLYAYGPGSDQFVGHYDNSYIGQTLADLLGIDLGELTRQLRGSEQAVAAY